MYARRLERSSTYTNRFLLTINTQMRSSSSDHETTFTIPFLIITTPNFTISTPDTCLVIDSLATCWTAKHPPNIQRNSRRIGIPIWSLLGGGMVLLVFLFSSLAESAQSEEEDKSGGFDDNSGGGGGRGNDSGRRKGSSIVEKFGLICTYQRVLGLMLYLLGCTINDLFDRDIDVAQLQKHIRATLNSGNLREAVRLPPGEDLNEWLAVNTVDFFNQVSLLYNTLTEFCTPENCPTMAAGPKYEYRWADGVQIKKPIEVSAPKYVEYVTDWIEAQLDDESIFPHIAGAPFPPNFKDVIKMIFKRLFRVYAHIYHSHFQMIVSLKEEAHLNTCFKHFILFTYEFGLMDKKEIAPLQELTESIIVRR